jgi:hypothetical protein
MKLRYFVVDRTGRLNRVAARDVQRLWQRECRTDEFGCPGANELKLVSVFCDADLLPRKVYLLRVPLTDGAFTPEDYLTLRIFTRRDCVTRQEAEEHHAAGWPSDLLRQLAVALDVPTLWLSEPLRIGGPLFVAAARGVTPNDAARYLLRR